MFRELLKREYVIFDGAMGTMLQAAGLKMGEVPEVLNVTNPELLINIHSQYIDAGANVIYANTFGANSYKLEGCGYSVKQLVEAGIANAREAVARSARQDVCVALDVGPIGQLLCPTGTLSSEEAYDIYKEIIEAGKGADLVVFETMTDLLEVKMAVLAAKENSELPVVATMTFEENMRTFTGCSVSAMALTLGGLGVDAMGMNCSLGPEEIEPIVKELEKWSSCPIIVKPNAGLPDPATNTYNVTPQEFAGRMSKMRLYNVTGFGGCCGTNPDFIRELTKVLKTARSEAKAYCRIPAVCSASRTVDITCPRVVGERINPTGKKLFKEALLKGDMDYIMNQALEQIEAGADILDVNVGLPGVDEKDMMVKTVMALQSITDIPLQIDSTNPEVIEAALRVYNGKALVNSVNGEDEVLEKILPIVKKYGAAVIGLCLDKDGIPSKAEARYAIAERICKRAMEYGIAREDIYIDCLTLTASAEQEAVMETLKAVNMVKNQLGLRTILGVSNISFGLPNRELVNHIFLTMALTNGLDLAIINPNNEAMMGAMRAYKLLANIDANSVEYIRAYGANPAVKKIEPKTSAEPEQALFNAVENGMKSEGVSLTRQLLTQKDSMEIINTILIPALDKIGEDFEKGRIFLPQLIMSAGVAKEAFEVIRKEMTTEASGQTKDKIVIATVKGDVHDIGKNIVKVLLENYGYDVIDLGKDVEYRTVVDAVKQHNARLLGLSALMTTTLVSMEETIKLVRSEIPDCKIMVGGAVLTPEYAKEIGADYYAKDAKESVDIAKKVLG